MRVFFQNHDRNFLLNDTQTHTWFPDVYASIVYLVTGTLTFADKTLLKQGNKMKLPAMRTEQMSLLMLHHNCG